MADQWHYTERGQRQGPVSAKQLTQLAAAGQLNSTDLVWKEGMAAWLPASRIKGLFSLPADDEPPPIPSDDEPPPIPPDDEPSPTAKNEPPAIPPENEPPPILPENGLPATRNEKSTFASVRSPTESSSILPLIMAALVVIALVGIGAYVYTHGGNTQVAKSDVDKETTAHSHDVSAQQYHVTPVGNDRGRRRQRAARRRRAASSCLRSALSRRSSTRYMRIASGWLCFQTSGSRLS